MVSLGRRSPRAAVVVAILMAPLAAGGQTYEMEDPVGIRDGWHVVRPGETLYDIAEMYLGTSDAWKLLFEFNPFLEDPDRIEPGQRIRVRVLSDVAPDAARIDQVSERVEEQLRPYEWQPATIKNFLNRRDGVRTFEGSSAVLEFSDESRLLVNEDTLVFLGRRGAVEQRVRRDEIEIVVGQADLEGSEGGDSYELVLGDSVLKPAPGPAGRSQARARRPEAGGAQLMVYEGESVVESGGSTLEIPRGMGTKMADGQPPEPPEELLPATRPIGPADGSVWPMSHPTFFWEPVDGASGYVVDLCHDAGCEQLAQRFDGLHGTEFEPQSLPAGAYHWRVTAVAPSGLDGYPSETLRFEVDGLVDHDPPIIDAAIVGGQVEIDGTLHLGGDGRIDIEVGDGEGTGIELAWATLDGRDYALDEVTGPWDSGRHRLEIVAEDRAGNRASSGPITFVYDPRPPVIRWRAEEGDVYRSATGERERFTDGPSARKRSWRLKPIVWHDGDGQWRPLEIGEAIEITGSEPAITLRTAKRKLRLYGDPYHFHRLRRRGGAVIEASDAQSRIEAMTVRLEADPEAPDRRRWLVVETEDRVGNRSRNVFELWRGHWVEAY